ncbi:MAG: 4Fe-4S dicluster domain-containing protein [Anaerolineales bacterium]|jgi:Fe-S-cluster-containing dehydrogenase component|nr:4Fe-4S dicluster domain-containing protein [Anaerolineales bacterium]
MKVFVVDATRCNGCYNCQIACKDEHCGNDWSPYAKPQPETGQFWMKLHEYVRGNVPHVKMTYVAQMCQHCEEAPCMAACPVEGGIYKREDGLVVIDPKKCSGCMNCLDACPYGVIYFNETLHIAQKCTGCAHLLDRGWKEPRCVDVCPTGALMFGEESELSARFAEGETLHPEFGIKTRVSYIGLPNKRFIAGTVYDPKANEVVIGATCTLSGEGDTFTQQTNHWGDFWFKDLKAGTYTLKIEAAGKTKTIADINAQKDIGLGDIPLE